MIWGLAKLCAAPVVAVLLAAATTAAATRHPAPSLNPASDKLLRLSAAQRAATLAQIVAHWCVGTDTFLMGIVSDGPGRGNAYWSLRCADGSAWAIQIDPAGEFTAIGCDTYEANAPGKQCFKKF